MNVSLFRKPDEEEILLQGRAEGPGKTLGDLVEVIRPGDVVLGWTYEEIRALGNCMHDLKPKPGWSRESLRTGRHAG
jgi:hypothetical protein